MAVGKHRDKLVKAGTEGEADSLQSLVSPDGPPSKPQPSLTLLSFRARVPSSCYGVKSPWGQPPRGGPQAQQWCRVAGKGKPESQGVIKKQDDKWRNAKRKRETKSLHLWSPQMVPHPSHSQT